MKKPMLNKRNSQKLAVVIPMYNEEKIARECIEKVIKQLKSLTIVSKLIIVNDGSLDKTITIVNRMRNKYPNKLIAINHKQNRGFGAANITGIKKALDLNFDWCLHMDSNLTNDPKYIKTFARYMSTDYDCIKASRYIKDSSVIGVPKYRRIISVVGNVLASYLFGVGK